MAWAFVIHRIFQLVLSQAVFVFGILKLRGEAAKETGISFFCKAVFMVGNSTQQKDKPDLISPSMDSFSKAPWKSPVLINHRRKAGDPGVDMVVSLSRK